MTEFNGFSKELVQFFKELEKNNTKQWFDQHRNEYEECVLSPSREFVAAMDSRLRKIAPEVNAIPKVNQSLFRINRDTRFSKDKSPYKTCMGIWFWAAGIIKGYRADMTKPTPMQNSFYITGCTPRWTRKFQSNFLRMRSSTMFLPIIKIWRPYMNGSKKLCQNKRT